MSKERNESIKIHSHEEIFLWRWLRSLSTPIRSVLTEIPWTWWLNNKHLFLTVMQCGKSKIKALTDQCLVSAHFLVHRRSLSPCILTWWTERALVSSTPYKGTNLIYEYLWHNYLLKAILPNTITVEILFQRMNFRGHKQSLAELQGTIFSVQDRTQLSGWTTTTT